MLSLWWVSLCSTQSHHARHTHTTAQWHTYVLPNLTCHSSKDGCISTYATLAACAAATSPRNAATFIICIGTDTRQTTVRVLASVSTVCEHRYPTREHSRSLRNWTEMMAVGTLHPTTASHQHTTGFKRMANLRRVHTCAHTQSRDYIWFIVSQM